MQTRHAVLLFLLVLTAIRLAMIGLTGLAPDEMYYYLWSQHPDWSYYSKGPGVAMVIRLGTEIFGPDAFGIRFFSPLFAFGTSLLVYVLGRRFYSESAGAWAAVLLNATPIFNAGSLLMTIDPISIFFWAAALLTCWNALESHRPVSLWWPLTGLLVGLGFLAKFTNAAFLFSLFLFLALSAPHRRHLRRSGPYILLAAFAICTLPPIIWNARNEWITIAHLQARGALDSAFAIDIAELAEFLAIHFGVYSPLIALGILLAIVWAWPLARRETGTLYLLVFGLPLIAAYALLSLKKAGEANWTAPAFVSLGVMAAGLWTRRIANGRASPVFAVSALALGAVMSLLLLNTDLVRMAGVRWPYAMDPTGRLKGWKTAAEAVHDLRLGIEAETGTPYFLIGDRYQTAASIGFHLPDPRIEGPGHPPVYIPESQNIENQFSFWPRYDEFLLEGNGGADDPHFTEQRGTNPFLGRNALYITDRPEGRPASSVVNGFTETRMIALLEIRRRGHTAREIRVFECLNYRTQPL